MAIVTFRLRLTILPAAGAISPARLGQSLPASGGVLLLRVFGGLEIRCLSSQAVGVDGDGRRLTNRRQLYLGRLCTYECELDNAQYVGRMTLLLTLVLLAETPVVHGGWSLVGHGIKSLLEAVRKLHRDKAALDGSYESAFDDVLDTKVLYGRLYSRREAAFVDDKVHEEFSEIVVASETFNRNRRIERGLDDLAASHVVTADGVVNDMLDNILSVERGVHRVVDGGLHGGQRLKAALHGCHLILSSVELRGLGSKSFLLGFELSSELFDGVDRGLLLLKLVLLGIELLFESLEVRRHVEDVTVMLFRGMRNSAGWG